MSLVRRRGTIQSEKFARKRRKKLIFAAILFIVAIASLFSAVFFFFRANFIQIKSVQVSGPVGINGGILSMVPADAVQAEIEGDLSENWLYLISKNTLFTYPGGLIRAQILKEYPPAESVDFESQGAFLGFGNNSSLVVYITERTPSALACADDSRCFYMDGTGFVYAPAPQDVAGNFIRYQLASSSSEIAVGQPLTDPATFAVAQKIITAVSGDGLTVAGDIIGADAYGPENEIIIDDGGSASVSASAATTTASTTQTDVYFNESEPLDIELRYFSEFWAQEATSSAVRFEYVDMRYGKDIVFKAYPSAAQVSGKDKNLQASSTN